MTPQPSEIARVTLVGAGPGDPGLLTIRGLARLRAAEVVLYDALANPSLLAHVPDGAECIDVGKRAGHHKLTQDQINQLMLEHARQGRRVVRLKGGDPYLFGRGAEEVVFLARHGVACEVVPGITAGIAAPAMAGIAVTHRGHASSVTFVTGHEDPAHPDTRVDYAGLARLLAAGGTVCFYMAVTHLAAIRQALLACGVTPSLPAALIQWGTLPRQRTVRATLDSVVDEVARAGVGSPAIFVVGVAAGLDEPGLDHFTTRPLFGQTVLITRTRPQASVLREKLEDLGAHVLEAPTIQLAPPGAQAAAEIDRALRHLSTFDWLILTSAAGVHALADRLFDLGLDSRALGATGVAVVGSATAAAVRDRLGIVADVVPQRFVADALADALLAEHRVVGQRVLLLRADLASRALPDRLAAGGAQVTDLPLYETRMVRALPDEVLAALRDGQVHWATFTSASTARNLLTLLGSNRTWLGSVRIASIGPTTTRALRDLDLPPQVEAAEATLDGLVAAMHRA